MSSISFRKSLESNEIELTFETYSCSWCGVVQETDLNKSLDIIRSYDKRRISIRSADQ